MDNDKHFPSGQNTISEQGGVLFFYITESITVCFYLTFTLSVRRLCSAPYVTLAVGPSFII